MQPSIVIKKVDAETGLAYSGNSYTTLAGAVFEVKYYKGKNTASGTPDGTWYFATKEENDEYKIRFSPDYVYSGNGYTSTNLPTDIDNISGGYEIESGTLVLTETIPPNGYLNIDSTNNGFLSYLDKSTNNWVSASDKSITVYLEAGTGAQAFYVGNQAIESEITYNDAPKRGELKFNKKKLNADGSTSAMAGVVFKIMLFII